jgi:hypothetical protein
VGVLVLRVVAVAAFFFLGDIREGDDKLHSSGSPNSSSLGFVVVCSGTLDNVVFLNIIINSVTNTYLLRTIYIYIYILYFL